MVVDGTFEFVGSNRAKANDVIAKSAAQPKGVVDLKIDNGKLLANISALPAHTDSTVFLAVTENGLSTSVGGGENSGVKLEHSTVVRDLVQLGTVKQNENSVSLDRAVPVNTEWKAENLKYVVFVQENDTLRVMAVSQVGH